MPLSCCIKQLKNERKAHFLNRIQIIYFQKGEDKILKKIGEECAEVIIACKNNDKEEVVKEMVDVFYHCFVLLAEKILHWKMSCGR